MKLKLHFEYKFNGLRKTIDETNPDIASAFERVAQTKESELVDLAIDCIVRVLYNKKTNTVQAMYYNPSATYGIDD